MSISYNYFLPTNIYGTLKVTDLSFVGYTAVNANIYCQRNINCDGQLQCGSFHSLGISSFDVLPTCITNATLATQLTNYQTVQNLITGAGGVTLAQVHTSILPFTAAQTIQSILKVSDPLSTGSNSSFQQIASTGYFVIANNNAPTGHFRFTLLNASILLEVMTMDASVFIIRSTTATLLNTTLSSLICSGTATFNGSFPTSTLGSNTGTNNNEFATVAYVKSLSSSLIPLNNTWTGTNAFNSFYPTTTLGNNTGTILNQFGTVGYINALVGSSGGSSLLPLNNNWSGTNNFQSVISTNITSPKIIISSALLNSAYLNIVTTSAYPGQIGFLPACNAGYLNPSTNSFDFVMNIGQNPTIGINQSYGFNICDYNSAYTGLRISGNGSSGNCNISCNGTFGTSQLYTAQNGIYINGGDFTSPNNSYINVVSCNAIQAITGTNVTVSATSFQIIPLASGTLPTALTNIAGLITNWGCAGQGETDFINQSRQNAGGFNFYSSPQTSLPALLMQITPTGTYIPSSLEVHKISSNNQQLEIFLANTQYVAPVLTGDSGLKLGWNISGGSGEVDFTALGQGGVSGFAYYASNASTLPYLIASLYPYLFNVIPPITSAGIITADHFLCTNSGASSGFYNMTASTISTANIGVGGSATFSGTTTFNVNHPTTTLGNNISTNTTQYATVGYVNSLINSTSFSSSSATNFNGFTIDYTSTISIYGMSNSNFFNSGIANTNYIMIEYKFIQFDNFLATIYSSTGTLLLFPQRIGTYTTAGSFGLQSQTALYKQYNINNGINGVTAFNDVSAVYAPNNRQYWNSCPAGGQNSGFVTTPTSFFINGTATASNISGSVASYGFTLPPISSTSTFTSTLTFNVIYNPFPTTITINNTSNSATQHL